MDLKFGLKIGHIEMQFEGSAEIFEAKFEPVLKELVEFGKGNFDLQEVSKTNGVSAPSKNPVPSMTVKSVAAKLGANSGSDLLYAAIATLSVLKQKEKITRQEINDEMKAAVGYYKPSYSSNLSNYIETLLKQGTLIEVSKDVFAVKESARSEMELKLA